MSKVKSAWAGAMPPDAYQAGASGAARWVAQEARKGHLDMAIAKQAAKQGDLFHVELWKMWQEADDELFEQATRLLSSKELVPLTVANDPLGRNWVAHFYESPQKLRALAARGLDPSAPFCGYPGHGQASAALIFCRAGMIRALASMAEAGFEPPAAAEGGARLLASGVDPVDLQSARDNEKALRWLCSDASSLDGVNEAGDDALKLAIKKGAAPIASLLLELGSDALARNHAGQDALDVLEQELGRSWGGNPKAALESLAPRLRAAREGIEIEAAAGGRAPSAMRPKAI